MSTPDWTVLEKLLLTQAVYKYGEDNWFQIARNLKHHALLDRPSDYFNQKNCSLQYYLMVEDIDKQKRQSLIQDMPVVVQLARELYSLRLEELKKAIAEDEEKFLILVSEIDDIRAGKWDNRLLGLLADESALSTSAANTPTAATSVAESETTSVSNTPLDESELSTSMNPTPSAIDDVLTTTASEDIDQQQQQEVTEVLASKEQLEADAEKDRLQEETEKIEADNLENEARAVKESDIIPIKEELESIESTADDTEEITPIEQEQQTAHKVDSIAESAAQEQGTERPVSNKRHVDDTDALDQPDLKRQKMETHLSMIPETLSSSSGNIESSQEKVPEEEEPIAIDTTAAVAYSTDVSRAATPADTTSDAHLRDGTESVAETESNAATPTSTTTTTTKRLAAANKADDQRHKSWLKNINLLWREIANHKNGAMFMNPIKETIAPHYYDIVKRPMDMKSIKNRIRDGLINTTIEFERDVILMLNNSLMYNKEGTEIYQMAREMLDDAQEQIKIFKTADTDTSASLHTRAASMAAKEQRRKSVVNE